MTKELFVSSTPHETKVGLVEDDQLAEIYLERENEYTLAGSIYKGRVTRVLPGMQSAFVDIGLERDAFLYVSDFMELEDQDEVEEVPTNQPSPETRFQARAVPGTGAAAAVAPAPEAEDESAPEIVADMEAPAAETRAPVPSESREDRGWRGRGRRRRGRRGERFPESKFARPAAEPAREAQPRSDYGPPPGYQPIILPGESISKYQRYVQAAPAQSVPPSGPQEDTAIAHSFPADEPLFSTSPTAESLASPASAVQQPREPHESSEKSASLETGSPEWDREQKRRHEMNVATVFGSDAHEEIEAAEFDEEEMTPSPELSKPVAAAGSGHTIEEEEIEEEEADLAHYVEDIEEDAAFEELEEETHAVDEYHEHGHEIAASVEPVTAEAVAISEHTEEAESGEVEVNAEEIADEEAELDEAQAEAEAALDAESQEVGSGDARAEVRAPAATAGYTQRAQRPAFDRRGPRGRRGGRRFRRHQPQNLPQITDLLKEGQEVLVQIAKEPIGKKGARITSHIALPGRFLVFMPTVNHTGVSRKIASEEERQRLKRIILSERENGQGGFIVRTAAQNASEEELRADIRFLKGLWAEIRSRAESSKSPALIYHDLNVVERVLRDQVTADFSVIWVDTEQEYERILRFANRFQPALVRRVKLYTKESPLFEQFGLTEEINKALKSKVWLKSGGYIVINQTEALVAIDVNTGKYVGKTARLEDTIVKTNVDAIKEIVRQVRLRDLGGIIVIDFIDMDERRNRQKVMQALEEALRSDRAPSKALQFNDFGLVAITRKRVKQSLERTIGSPCPYCQATGYVKSVQTVCNEIYVEMRKLAKHLEHPDVMLRVNPEVAKALKSNNGRALNEMEELTKKTVIVKSDPALHQEQFDIN
ncbi:MAG TPA: Rne/Rng family ribonuclease [Terriglobales bacterium]|nr:Rne/Rng family ribonuclease [Terriglobales bacterium]